MHQLTSCRRLGVWWHRSSACWSGATNAQSWPRGATAHDKHFLAKKSCPACKKTVSNSSSFLTPHCLLHFSTSNSKKVTLRQIWAPFSIWRRYLLNISNCGFGLASASKVWTHPPTKSVSKPLNAAVMLMIQQSCDSWQWFFPMRLVTSNCPMTHPVLLMCLWCDDVMLH